MKCKAFLLTFLLLIGGLTVSAVAQINVNQKTKLIIKAINAQQDGAVIPNARVVLKGKNYRFEGVTDNNGKFEVEVPSKIYQLIVESYGFNKYVRKEIKLVGTMTLTLNADLIPAGIVSH
ncbi:MAG: carboxypeptidase-like regulatory domain-containing protein [Acidobacteriota bacterium]|nr:carboxypeptidase-like regulatory domain-containing protein [Acidobacteriota bacterium]